MGAAWGTWMAVAVLCVLVVPSLCGLSGEASVGEGQWRAGEGEGMGGGGEDEWESVWGVWKSGENSAAPVGQLPYQASASTFDQFTGYVSVNSSATRRMFYWFVESQRSPASDPLVLWLQGGPGCAGSWAIFEEHGPYRIAANQSILDNPNSWNRVANVIYVDSPPCTGVGFSDSGGQPCHTDDHQTAADNLTFLLAFLDLFPQFSYNDLWLTGESYGGVYVPMLAERIVSGGNETAALASRLKGFMVGNPVLACPEGEVEYFNEQIDLFYYHGLISFSSRSQWKESCAANSLTVECISMYESIRGTIGTENFVGDDLYANLCTGNGTLDAFEEVEHCISLGMRTEWYMNNPSVQSALHAVPGLWRSCGDPNLRYSQSGANMLRYYDLLYEMAPELKILVFSGDVDINTIPHALTQFCLNLLDRPVLEPWKPWRMQGPRLPQHIPNSEENSNVTAGYAQAHEGYTFATVKGAGHEVALYQPAFAFELFQRFLAHGNLWQG